MVVDLHSPPSGSGDPGPSLFTTAECQGKFVEVWQKMARRYRDAKVVWGYDLVNEPIETGRRRGASTGRSWPSGRRRPCARSTRSARSSSSARWAQPGGFTDFQPIEVPNVVYSVHMYMPHTFTHQGVFDGWEKKWLYPGEIDGERWDKAQLERALKPVIDFQKRYRVQIYVGEFSAIRWAPDGSACRYLRD